MTRREQRGSRLVRLRVELRAANSASRRARSRATATWLAAASRSRRSSATNSSRTGRDGRRVPNAISPLGIGTLDRRVRRSCRAACAERRTSDLPPSARDRAARQAKRIEQRRREIVEDAIERLAGEEPCRGQVQEPRLALPTGRAVAFGHAARPPTPRARARRGRARARPRLRGCDPERVERLGEEEDEGRGSRAASSRSPPRSPGHRGGHDGEQEERDGRRAALGLNDQGESERERRDATAEATIGSARELHRGPASTARSRRHATASTASSRVRPRLHESFTPQRRRLR